MRRNLNHEYSQVFFTATNAIQKNFFTSSFINNRCGCAQSIVYVLAALTTLCNVHAVLHIFNGKQWRLGPRLKIVLSSTLSRLLFKSLHAHIPTFFCTFAFGKTNYWEGKKPLFFRLVITFKLLLAKRQLA